MRGPPAVDCTAHRSALIVPRRGMAQVGSMLRLEFTVLDLAYGDELGIFRDASGSKQSRVTTVNTLSRLPLLLWYVRT